MNRTQWDFAARWWVVIAAAIIAIFGFAQALTDGAVTFQAGLIAMCVAMVTLVQAIGMRNWMLAIGAVGGLASGYLWVAGGADVSPAHPLLFGLLLALAGVGLFGSIGVLLILMPNSSRSRRPGP